MNDNVVYFSYSDSQPHDGGMARNHAFLAEMEKRKARIYNHKFINLPYRILSMIRNLFLLLVLRDKKILILQTVFLKFIFPFALFKFSWYRYFVQILLDFVCKRNKIYIEINDLIYEQAIDLGININPTALEYEKFIFKKTGLHFIFASKLMGEYVAKTYGLNRSHFQTIINGAPELNCGIKYKLSVSDTDRIKYIYAGTLNKGRGIENFITIFSKIPTVDLILIGTEGEWIENYKYKNIFYLGKFEEEMALAIASKCDIGIIPYDNKKLYYNICYPTKNSFYIAAGIPILCTPLAETMRVFKDFQGICFFEYLNSWDNFLKNTSAADISEMKILVERERQQFSWETLLGEMQID